MRPTQVLRGAHLPDKPDHEPLRCVQCVHAMENIRLRLPPPQEPSLPGSEAEDELMDLDPRVAEYVLDSSVNSA